MTYAEAKAYVNQIGQSGIMPGLSRIDLLLDHIAHPEKRLNIIHVAGTNGKGSVCTFLAAILTASGYHVGRYISPTLFDYREKLQIDGTWISELDMANCLTVAANANESMKSTSNAGASAFELETAAAFYYFNQQNVDFVILETGMGGLGDATNVIDTNVMSIITSIGMDHMRFLGNNLTDIAYQKAGIIKKGRPVIIDGTSSNDAIQMITKVCNTQASKFTVVMPDAITSETADIIEGQQFSVGNLQHLKIRMPGCYQLQNASVALAAIRCLQNMSSCDFRRPLKKLPKRALDNYKVKEGLLRARWPGRFEILKTHPYFIVDGAHNPAGAMALRDTINYYFKDKKTILMMAVFADKDYINILKIMSDVSETLIVYRPENERGLDAHTLAASASDYFHTVICTQSQDDAIHHALKISNEADVIVSFGSLSTIAGIYDIIKVYYGKY